MSLRSKRLAAALDPAAAALLDSTHEDAHLARDDLLGSIAHVAALKDAKVLAPKEAQALASALAAALSEADAERFTLQADLEDVHMNVEAWLTQRLGDLGKKLHTARSRNDQVALDLRLAARRHLLAQSGRLVELVEALHALGAKAPDAVMPGYTHAQPAQPVTFAHWTGLHAERLLRDLDRLQDAWDRVNVSPLGAAALAGTGFPIDPAATARRLAFDAPFANSLDAVSDRDFLVELASAWAQAAVHVSQLAEDVILYTCPAYGFLALDDAYATGSSIMPQKRNPDVFEVARAAAGTAIGELVAVLTIAKGLPSAYNRDLQEQKRVALLGWRHQLRVLGVLPGAVASLMPVPKAMEAAAGVGFTDATEVADHLVRAGVPFRDAHGLAAELVLEAAAAGTALSGLPPATLQKVLGPHAKGVSAVLGAQAAVSAKKSPGGAAPSAVRAQNQGQERRLASLSTFFAAKANALATAENALLQELATLQEVKS